MVRAVGAAVLVWLGCLFGCSGKTVGEEGGEGGEPAAPSPQVSPQKQCETYAKKWCGKAFACYVQVGRLAESARQQNVDKCVKVVEDSLPCSAVNSVGQGYGACMSGIEAMSCSKWDVPSNQIGTIVPPPGCDDALVISG